MSEQQHPFERARARSQQTLARMRDIEYEATIVRFLLTKLNLSRYRHELIAAYRRRTDEALLTLTAFNERFSSFPIFFGADRLAGIKLHLCAAAFLPALFNAFGSAPFVKAYDEFCDAQHAQAGTRTLGLAFPRKGIRPAFLIHNGGLDAYRYHGTVLVHRGGTSSNPADLYLQPLGSLIAAIAKSGWRPDE